jgi:hypothetical protein
MQWIQGDLSLGVKLPGRETDHLRLVPRSRIRGAIPPFPNTPSWRGAELKHRDNWFEVGNIPGDVTAQCNGVYSSLRGTKK